VGVPEITPVFELKFMPGGRLGDIVKIPDSFPIHSEAATVA
jgi:hypothetical protein